MSTNTRIEPRTENRVLSGSTENRRPLFIPALCAARMGGWRLQPVDSIQPLLLARPDNSQEAVHVAHRLNRLVAKPQEAVDIAHADGVGQGLGALEREAEQLLPAQPMHVAECGDRKIDLGYAIGVVVGQAIGVLIGF